jgi:hypothetical protein
MNSGSVPQQPPTMLSQPFRAHSPSCGARVSAVSGKPVGDSGSGRPAFGYALTKIGAIPDSSSMNGRISLGPSAQFRPTDSSGACEIEFHIASRLCPDRFPRPGR